MVFKRLYSTNGIFWKNIKSCDCDVLDEWWYMSTKISHFSNAKELIPKFKTIEDVKEYEDEERQRVIKRNSEIYKINQKKKEERDNVYKKFS